MNIPFLDLSRLGEDLKTQLKERFSRVLESGVFSGGKEVDNFESSISRFLGSAYSISCGNGTDALELALRALKIGPGDEIIVPAMTWVSTAEAVVLVGAKPIFWDTNQEGLLRPDWDKAVTPKTKAVIPAHLYGKMIPMSALIEKASQLNLFVIEDAAQAFGSFQDGKAAGSWGDVGCLSYYPTKNLGALGEAGMCLTQNLILAKTIRLLLNHGQPFRDRHEIVGRNSRIDAIQAVFLQVLLEDFTKNQLRRKILAQRYNESFAKIPELILPEGILESDHNAHLYVVQTNQRDDLKKFLASRGIGTAIHYPQILPDMKSFLAKGDFINALNLAKMGLSLPLNPYLMDQEVEFIIDSVQKFFS